VTLPLRTRVRMRASIALSTALRGVPAGAVGRFRDSYAAAGTVRRRLLHPVAMVLRHRPLAPLADFVLAGDPPVRLAAVESRLARLLYWYGERGYEGCETLWWRRLCAQASSIVELGANIGYYTVQGATAAPTARYVTVEANPSSAEIVRRNVELNGLSQVEVVAAAAVGDGDAARVELALPDRESYTVPTGAYLSAGAEGIANRPAANSVTVPGIAATELLADADLIKLDIEGYEARVLESARAHLAANRPTIVVEVLRDVPRLRRLIRELHADGYLAFAIGTDSLHLLTVDELASQDPLPRYGSRDVILVPAERAGTL
jgi:FkbM family methyltransferase